jgi:hypothetical protein
MYNVGQWSVNKLGSEPEKQSKTSFEISYAVEHQIPVIGDWKTKWVLEEDNHISKLNDKFRELEGRLNQTRQYLPKMPIFITINFEQFHKNTDTLLLFYNKIKEWQKWFDGLVKILDMELGVLEGKDEKKDKTENSGRKKGLMTTSQSLKYKKKMVEYDKPKREDRTDQNKDCWGIGKKDNDDECKTCKDFLSCDEEAEATLERSYMG